MSTYTSMTSVADQLISLSNGVDNVPRQYFYNFDENNDNNEHRDDLSKKYDDGTLHDGPHGNGLPSPCSQELIDIDDRSKTERHRLDRYLNSLLRNYKLSHGRNKKKTASKETLSNAIIHDEQGGLLDHSSEGSFMGRSAYENSPNQRNEKKSEGQREIRKCDLCNITFGSYKSFRMHVSNSHTKRSQVHPRHLVHSVTSKLSKSPARRVGNSDVSKIPCKTELALKNPVMSNLSSNVDGEFRVFDTSGGSENAQRKTYEENDNITDGEMNEMYEQCDSVSEQEEIIEDKALNKTDSQPEIVQPEFIDHDSRFSMKTTESQHHASESLFEDTQCTRTLTFKQQMELFRSHTFKMKQQQANDRLLIREQNNMDLESVSATSCKSNFNRFSYNDHEQTKYHESSNQLEGIGNPTENYFPTKYLKTNPLSLRKTFFNETHEHAFKVYDEHPCNNESKVESDNKRVPFHEDSNSVIFQYSYSADTHSPLCNSHSHSSNTPSSLCHSHSQSSNTPSSLCHSHSHSTNTPSSLCHPHSHSSNTPSSLCHSHSHSLNTPSSLCHSHSHSSNTPSALCNLQSHSLNILTSLCDSPNSLPSENVYSCARTKSISQHRLDNILHKKEGDYTRSRLQFWMDKASELLDNGPSLYDLMYHNNSDETSATLNNVPNEADNVEDRPDITHVDKESTSYMCMVDHNSQNNQNYLSQVQNPLSMSYQSRKGTVGSSIEIERDSYTSKCSTEGDVVEHGTNEPPKDILHPCSKRSNDAEGLCGIRSIVDVSAQVVSHEHVPLPEDEGATVCPVITGITSQVFIETPDFVDRGWIFLDDNVSDYVIFHSDVDDNDN